MDIQNTHTAATPGLAYCTCCAPGQILIPRDDLGEPGRWAVCLATGAWYEARDGRFVATAAPREGAILPAPARTAAPTPVGWRTGDGGWTGGDARPAIVPGVRIDLSKESYA
jgi:hypothetical protein